MKKNMINKLNSFILAKLIGLRYQAVFRRIPTINEKDQKRTGAYDV